MHAVKKSLMSILASVLVLTLIAGCSSSGTGSSENSSAYNSEEPNTVEKDAKLLVWEGSGVNGQWMKAVAEEFTKQFNIPVDVQIVESGDSPSKLQTDGPAGLAADVFVAPHDHVGNMEAAGLILPNDNFSEEDKSKFIESAINALSVNGELFGYPSGIETYALYYNKALVSTLPQSFDELIEMAGRLTDKSSKKYGLLWQMGNLYYDAAFIYGFGGYVFGKNGTDATDIGLNNDGAVQALDYIKKIHTVVPFKQEDVTYDIKESLFKEGKLAFNINGPSAAPSFVEAGVDFGVIALPKLPNGEHPKSFSGIRAFFVNSYTKYPEAAKQFAKFATSKEMLVKRYEMTQSIAPHKDLLEDPRIKADAVSSAFLEQATYSVPMPAIPEMPAVWAPVAVAITEAWNNGADSKKALDQAVIQIKDAIATAKKQNK